MQPSRTDSRPWAAAPWRPATAVAQYPAGALNPSETVEIADPFRKLAFYSACLLLFTRVSVLNQILSVELHFNPYLLYLVGVPTGIGILVGGGLTRTLRARTAFFWVAFVLWAGIGLPFSSWRGGSLPFYLTYLRTDFIMLFAIGGLVATWRECKWMMWSVAAGATVNLLSAQLFRGGVDDTRVALEFGTIANSNDYAAHLLFALPFLLWVGFGSRSLVVRVPALVGVVYGTYLILATASRGAAIALTCDILLFVYFASALQRFVAVIVLPIGLALALAILPHSTLQRIRSFSEGEGSSEEALESSRARKYVLEKSIEYTVHFPVFGVGIGRFPSYEGVHNQVVGEHGAWLQTHNSYTQVSTECGVPAFILFFGGIVSAFRLLLKTYRQARARSDCVDISRVTLCVLVALAGFSVAIIFLSLAYTFYLPALAGLAIGLSRAAASEFRVRPQVPPRALAYVPPVPAGVPATGSRALPAAVRPA